MLAANAVAAVATIVFAFHLASPCGEPGRSLLRRVAESMYRGVELHHLVNGRAGCPPVTPALIV